MSLANKKFKNNKTGEVVKIIDSFEDLAILENKQKVSVTDLLNPLSYTEEIDPLNFFNNQGAYNVLAEKIKSIPQEFIKEDDSPNGITPTYEDEDDFRPAINESAIIMSTMEDERAELAKKYGVSVDNTDSLSRQNEAFSKILGEDSDDLPKIPQSKYSEPEPEVQRFEAKREEVSKQDFVSSISDTPQPSNTQNQIRQQPKVEDPIISMFKNVKRNVEFKINLEFSNKIPRLDFIEMMEDSYQTSIIEFLADEFTNKIIQNPELIRNTIMDKIKHLVYGSDIKREVLERDESETIAKTKTISKPKLTKVEKHEPLSIEKEPVLAKDLPKKPIKRRSIKKEDE
jgi:hypothetical protein